MGWHSDLLPLINPAAWFLFGRTSGRFDSLEWRAYRQIVGVSWAAPGQFEGGAPILEVRGPRDYLYRRDPKNPMAFVSTTMGRVDPGNMATDDGSVPRLAWSIPGLDPWTWTPAFLIHDWLFTCHHTGSDGGAVTFEQANRYLGEAIVTMMTADPKIQDWRVAVAIMAAVSSPLGRQVWDREWMAEQKAAALALN